MNLRLKEAKDNALKYFQSHEITDEDQTLISLFLSAIKGSNVLIISKIESQPLEWNAFKYMHGEFFKDTQLYTLLARATQWAMNPELYVKGAQFNFELWNKANLPSYLMGTFDKDKHFFRYLALSHAFKSVVRFIPFFPSQMPMETPFLSTLHEIEVQNGREIQTQIALLKNMEIPSLSIEQKEEIVREERDFVSGFFAEFLEYLVERK